LNVQKLHRTSGQAYLDGNTLFNASDCGGNAAGFVIHSAIHFARQRSALLQHLHHQAPGPACDLRALPKRNRPREENASDVK
jgi:hypothetical protein